MKDARRLRIPRTTALALFPWRCYSRFSGHMELDTTGYSAIISLDVGIDTWEEKEKVDICY